MGDARRITGSRENAIAFGLSALLGVAVWGLSSPLTGRSEPWDAYNYYYLVAMLASGAIVGSLCPWRLGAACAGSCLGQTLAALVLLPLGPLAPLGLAFLLAYAVATSVAGVAIGSALRRAVAALNRRFLHGRPQLEHLAVALLVALVAAPAAGWVWRQRAMLAPAVSPASTPAELRAAFSSAAATGAIDVLDRLALNPALPAELAQTLHDDAVARERRRIGSAYPVLLHLAQHANTPPGVLVELAGSREKTVRMKVAMNPHTPPELLKQLARDPDALVRTWITWNPALPDDALIGLSRDADSSVRSRALATMQRRGLRSN